ncbi:MAG TPA: phosphate ABC transporter ATP-binding protein PstB [bacterium]|nr:phosphate ABC transporter ATP-binding protein PstB [bacterium]
MNQAAAIAPEPNKVEVKSLNYFYGTEQALFGVDMAIADKQITAIIGPSGCGKSTLIKAINRIGEIANDIKIEGDVLLDGGSVYSKSVNLVELRRRVGMVFQKPNPFPKSIVENVLFGPKLHGVRDRGQLEEIVETSLKKAALWNEVKDKLSKSAMELSGGQQQRLCIARALAVDPEVLLMDEPCSALDPIGTSRIEETLEVLKSQYCIVIVTHNMQQAARVSQSTAFFMKGKIIEYDETQKIFTKPSEKLTEDYITGRFG